MIISGGQSKSYSLQMMKTENDSLKGFQQRIEGIDEQIAQLKENETIDEKEKIKKINALEEQKQALMAQIQKEKAEKAKETTEKIQEVASKQAGQPVEEDQPISAGVSTAIIESSALLSSIKEQTSIASGLRREAKVLQKEVDTDRGRGQGVDSKDYRIEKIKKDKKSAAKIDENISNDLKKLYEKKDDEEDEKKLSKEDKYSRGQHVDTRC